MASLDSAFYEEEMKTKFSIGDKVRIKKSVDSQTDPADLSLQESFYKEMCESGIEYLTITDIRKTSSEDLIYFRPRLLDQASVYDYRLELVPEERT